MSHRPHVALVLGLCLTACAEGRYGIEGTVRSVVDQQRQGLAGVRVVVHPAGRQPRPGMEVVSDAAGHFETQYWFGGSLFCRGEACDGVPVLELTSPDHRTCTVRLRAKDNQAGVARRECSRPARSCFAIDVMLAPLGNSASLGETCADR